MSHSCSLFIFPTQVCLQSRFVIKICLKFIKVESQSIARLYLRFPRTQDNFFCTWIIDTNFFFLPFFLSLSSIISWNDFNIHRGAKKKGEKEGKHSWRVKQSINLLYNYNLHTCSNTEQNRTHPRWCWIERKKRGKKANWKKASRDILTTCLPARAYKNTILLKRFFTVKMYSSLQ